MFGDLSFRRLTEAIEAPEPQREGFLTAQSSVFTRAGRFLFTRGIPRGNRSPFVEGGQAAQMAENLNQTGRSERRLKVRCEVSLPVSVSVLQPEMTFTPTSMKGTAVDLSATGMRVQTAGMSRKDYTDLLKTVHFCKVDLLLPGLSEMMTVRAQIVWIDYHEQQGEPNHAVLGLSFYAVRLDRQQALERFLNSMAAQNVPGAAPAK